MKQICFALLVGLALASTVVVPARAQSVESLFGAAQHQEEVEGNLKAAIDSYQKVIQKAGVNRELAARAHYRTGQCYEKLGQREASKSYENIVKNFADQRKLVAQARARLAALGAPIGGALTARRVIESGHPGWGISLDGRYAAHARSYFDKGGLLVSDLTTGEERRIPSVSDNESVSNAIISPDGKWVCYGSQPNWGMEELRVVGMDGTGLKTIFKTGKETNVGWVYPVGWTHDGREVLVTFNRPGSPTAVAPRLIGYHVGMIPVETGRLRVLKEFDFGYYRWASISPDGKWVAYNVQTSPDNVECDIHVIRTDGTGERKLVDHPADDTEPVWVPDGRGLVFRSNRRGSIDAWFVRVKDGQAQGEPEMIKADSGELLGVTRQGTLFYTSSAGSMDINLATLDESTGKLIGGVEKLPLAYSGQKQSAVLSPDGQGLAYLRPSMRTPRAAVVVLRSMKTGEERELNPKVKNLRTIGWYPDGRSLVSFGRDMKDRFAVFQIDVTTGNTTFLYNLFTVNGLNFGYNQRAPSVAPDGKTFYQRASKWAGAVQSDSMIFGLNSETKEFREIFRSNRTQLDVPVISPDGQHVAAIFTEGSATRRGLLEVNVQTGAMRELCPTPPGTQASVAGWTPDSRNVVMVIAGEDPKMNDVWCVPLDGAPPQKSAVPGISLRDPDNATLRTHSSGNRLVWTSGDSDLRTEIWALDNALPRK